MLSNIFKIHCIYFSFINIVYMIKIILLSNFVKITTLLHYMNKYFSINNLNIIYFAINNITNLYFCSFKKDSFLYIYFYIKL